MARCVITRAQREDDKTSVQLGFTNAPIVFQADAEKSIFIKGEYTSARYELLSQPKSSARKKQSSEIEAWKFILPMVV